MHTSDFTTVTTILRPPYQLIYALPLLFVSILLLFAGTFLTLDRTRSFASSSDVKTKPPLYRLESGIGGLAIGWALGAHTSTLLALLILNQTETARLSAPAFLVVWLMSAIALTLLCGRWKYVALALGGILGGACTGLILAISLHPSLLARLILALIATISLTVGTLLPFPLVRHTCLRIGTSAAGAAGIINICAILGSSATNNKLASWANAWLHFVLLHDSDSAELQWGTGKAKGLTAAAYFLWMIGAACDWWLKQRIGENPDEAWDNVLGSYAASFPPESSRTGTFTPLKSRWSILKEKLHMSPTSANTSKPLLFPSDSELARSTPTPRQGPKAPPVFRPRKPGTFMPDPYYSDSDSDLGDGEKTMHRPTQERKWTASTNYSDATLVNPQPERPRRHRGMGTAFSHPPVFTASPAGSHIEYGDKDSERSPELNMGIHRIEPSKDEDKDWKPVFLKRSESLRSGKMEMASGPGEEDSRDVTSAHSTAILSAPRDYSAPHTPLQGHSGAGTPVYAHHGAASSTPGLVPATPSLIRAIDRVSRAQRLAYTGGVAAAPMGDSTRGTLSNTHDDRRISRENMVQGLPGSRDQGDDHRWEGFWADVQRKAVEP